MRFPKASTQVSVGSKTVKMQRFSQTFFWAVWHITTSCRNSASSNAYGNGVPASLRWWWLFAVPNFVWRFSASALFQGFLWVSIFAGRSNRVVFFESGGTDWSCGYHWFIITEVLSICFTTAPFEAICAGICWWPNSSNRCRERSKVPEALHKCRSKRVCTSISETSTKHQEILQRRCRRTTSDDWGCRRFAQWFAAGRSTGWKQTLPTAFSVCCMAALTDGKSSPYQTDGWSAKGFFWCLTVPHQENCDPNVATLGFGRWSYLPNGGSSGDLHLSIAGEGTLCPGKCEGRFRCNEAVATAAIFVGCRPNRRRCQVWWANRNGRETETTAGEERRDGSVSRRRLSSQQKNENIGKCFPFWGGCSVEVFPM